MKNHWDKKGAALLGAPLLAAGAAFCWTQNNLLQVTRQEYAGPRVPQGFDGFKILHVSDLHNKAFGRGQARLLRVIEREGPGLIAVTGDLIDKRRTRPGGLGPALAFAAGAAALAPVCFVPGNHEGTARAVYAELRRALSRLGVRVLEGESLPVCRGGDTITLLGMPDTKFFPGPAAYRAALHHLAGAAPAGGLRVLLAHRPDRLRLYAREGVDLALCGHAHGGQVRLPFVGGLYTPDGGFFPPLTAGMHCRGATHMVISRGLGNSGAPLRVFNLPELVSVTLRHTEGPAAEHRAPEPWADSKK